MPRKNKDGTRDYSWEKKYQGTKKQKKNRARRNKDRRKAIADGRAKKGDGKEIDHTPPLSKVGSKGKSKTRVVSKKTNRKKYNKTTKKVTRRRKK